MTAGLLLMLLPAAGIILPILVSIDAKNKQLEAVMTEIATQTGLNFHYDKADLSQRLKKKITLHCIKTPIEEVLQQLGRQTGLKFVLKEDKIIVGPATDTPADTELLNLALGEKEITGHISDPQGRPLAGATILVKNSTRGAQALADGTFSIKGTAADVLVFRSVGHLQGSRHRRQQRDQHHPGRKHQRPERICSDRPGYFQTNQ
jgi:hypothetical protein